METEDSQTSPKSGQIKMPERNRFSINYHSLSPKKTSPMKTDDRYQYQSTLVPGGSGQKKIAVEYDNLKLIKKLREAKFAIHLVMSIINGRYYVMKIFPYVDLKINSSFQKEARMININHPNIIQIISKEDVKESFFGLKCPTYSYLLIELAPYGNFLDLILKKKLPIDDVLLRTFFVQMVNAVEHLHSKGYYHLDIKPDNFVLCEDFIVKLIDFDSSVNQSEGFPQTTGTKNFRSPELKIKSCKNPSAADIYSLGIVLFTLKCRMLPYVEDTLVGGYNLAELLWKGDDNFWEAHHDCQDLVLHCDADFNELFMSMVKGYPEDRITLKGIKKSKWFNGEIYTKKEVKVIMEDVLGTSSKKKRKFF